MHRGSDQHESKAPADTPIFQMQGRACLLHLLAGRYGADRVLRDRRTNHM